MRAQAGSMPASYPRQPAQTGHLAGHGPEGAGLLAGPDRGQAGQASEPAGLKAGPGREHGRAHGGGRRRRPTVKVDGERGEGSGGKAKGKRNSPCSLGCGRQRRRGAERTARARREEEERRPAPEEVEDAGVVSGEPSPIPPVGRGKRSRRRCWRRLFVPGNSKDGESRARRPRP